MVELRNCLVLFTLFWGPNFAQANGSSGVGSAIVALNDEVAGSSFNGRLKLQNRQIVDETMKKTIFELQQIRRDEVERLQASMRLVPSRLGQVQAYEYVTSDDGPQNKEAENNYWVFCSPDGADSCLKLVSLRNEPAARDSIQASFVGSLIQVKQR